ncbi:MAG: hypothetical protein IPK64_13395 [bacterium]|nr:hypothetical protein [bacterium]
MTIAAKTMCSSAVGRTALAILSITTVCGASAAADWAPSKAAANSGAAAGAVVADVNEASWSGLGTGVDSAVEALAVDRHGRLYAGGSFHLAGGATVNQVARWDGFQWSALGSGMVERVFALAVAANGDVYAGGAFWAADGAPAAHIARWDGTSWSALGPGLDGWVYALAFDPNGHLYAAGEFSNSGSTRVRGVARWDGTNWSALGSGLGGSYESNSGYALAVDDNGVYVGGYFTTAGGVPASRIARWDGSAWSALGTGTNDGVEALAVDANGNLYAGGWFTTAGGVPTARLARWDGTTWSALGTGTHGGFFALALDAHGNLHTGIARWDGASWSDIGSGLEGSVRALAPRGSADLFVGGSFATAGGTPAANVALWHEPTPSPVPLDGTARARMTLFDAVPNPFNPRTTLRFELPHTALVHLAIHDLRGRLVRSLVDEELAAGEHEKVWNGLDDTGAPVASGTYLARIDAGGQLATSWLTLIR